MTRDLPSREPDLRGPVARSALRIRTAGLGYAYVTSQMGTTFTGDPRDLALRDALPATLSFA